VQAHGGGDFPAPSPASTFKTPFRNPIPGNAVETCSILTTTPNAVTSAVHDRMPVILDPDNYDLWLDPGRMPVNS
jgi:putative SOS response-associated peptidase YedK